MTISNATIERVAIRDLMENGLARRRRLDPLRHSLGGRQLVFRDLVSSPRPGLHPRHNRSWKKGVNILHFLGGSQSTWPAREPGRTPR
jgi:hypothetical protein